MENQTLKTITMKKIIEGMLRIALHANPASPEKNQRAVDARISEGLEKWIAGKGYCQSEQSLADVAEAIDVSPDSLSYFCTTVLGDRFTTFRKRLRIEEAHRIIKEHPDYRIVKVAYMVGILDKGNFRKQFYEFYHCSPSEWQQKCRKNRK